MALLGEAQKNVCSTQILGFSRDPLWMILAVSHQFARHLVMELCDGGDLFSCINSQSEQGSFSTGHGLAGMGGGVRKSHPPRGCVGFME